MLALYSVLIIILISSVSSFKVPTSNRQSSQKLSAGNVHDILHLASTLPISGILQGVPADQAKKEFVFFFFGIIHDY